MAVEIFTAFIVLVTVSITGCRGQCESTNRPKLLYAGEYFKTITSPGYPSTSYPHNSKCSWQLTANSHDRIVHLHIEELELDSDYYNCRSDYVDLYDGNYFEKEPTASTPKLAHVCSSLYGRDFYSTSTLMYVLFVSDSYDTAKGFSLSYRTLPRSALTTTSALPNTTTTAKDTSDDSFDKSLYIVKIVGIFLGALAGLIILIVVIILVLRRFVRPCLLDDHDHHPLPMTVPSAPPPYETLAGEGRPPRNPPPHISEPVLTSHQRIPGTPVINDRREGAGHGDGPPDRPLSGNQLEVPAQNGRSGSPRPPGSRGGSPRGSPRPRSPRDWDRGPGDGDRRPRDWDRGPGGGDRSPRDWDRSPRGGDRSPREWDRSPGGGDRSSRDWDRGPRGGDRSPRGGDRSPRGGDRSPRDWDRGPGGGDRSPRGWDRSPRDWDRSPRGGDRSPRGGDRSPRGGDRSRSPSGRPPPIPPPDSSGPASMDAPPTYAEVMATTPQPSAPPPE